MKKRITSIVIIFIMILCLCPGESMAETDAQEQEAAAETSVTGLMTETTKPASSQLKDTIKVTPANGREVCLQMYEEEQKQWETMQTFTAGSGVTEKVVLTYPDDWKKTNTSLWRIVIEEGSGGTAYTSPEIKVMTRNRKTLKLSAKSAIIMEKSSGQIFYGKKMNTQRANASTTKIMTSILALEHKKWDSKATISQNAIKTPYTTLKYKKNDTVKMKHLIYAAMVRSDNGSATALAEHTAGSKAAFAKMMNAKAEELGCVNTHFVNPHGLDNKKHYSSAKDLALISRYALKNANFRKVIKTKSYSFTTTKYHKKYSFKTTNQLLGKVEGLYGIKTGTEDDAGCCFAGAYKYKGKTYITVVLGCKRDAQRWEDTKTLIRYIKKYI